VEKTVVDKTGENDVEKANLRFQKGTSSRSCPFEKEARL
jgi:hypothetical protein